MTIVSVCPGVFRASLMSPVCWGVSLVHKYHSVSVSECPSVVPMQQCPSVVLSVPMHQCCPQCCGSVARWRDNHSLAMQCKDFHCPRFATLMTFPLPSKLCPVCTKACSKEHSLLRPVLGLPFSTKTTWVACTREMMIFPRAAATNDHPPLSRPADLQVTRLRDTFSVGELIFGFLETASGELLLQKLSCITSQFTEKKL